jgi:hypothetical protein
MGKIMLDKEREARLSLGAMKRFKALTGKSLMHGIDLETLTEDEVITLFWVSMVEDDPTLTLERTEQIVDLSNMVDAVMALTKKEVPDPLASGGPGLN